MLQHARIWSNGPGPSRFPDWPPFSSRVSLVGRAPQTVEVPSVFVVLGSRPTAKTAIAAAVVSSGARRMWCPRPGGLHRLSCRRGGRLAAAAAAAAEGAEGGGKVADGGEEAEVSATSSTPKSRLAQWWRKNGKLDRKRLSKMGLMCVLSYGFVSNMNAMLLMCMSTYVAMSRTGASPLTSAAALRQFGITYGGLYLISNLIRPLRIGLALSISPVFDKFIKSIEQTLGCKRWLAITLTVLLANVVGTFAFLFGGLGLASALTGVPINIAQLGTLIRAGKAARTAVA
eukprot:CAMPEP_0115251534 /NCGR_PEP_ID=MMETSP0270-20121206/43679_1 /TAXON_ID=71861 /ORGANISM="Scrippsiella trochoidea, Strain CCMP3099" /LENGTH=286 /DNA_ID=CAMNT_0002666957 /DNA_START=19 /DNA_END=875 /DNA_ORIENTATION=+